MLTAFIVNVVYLEIHFVLCKSRFCAGQNWGDQDESEGTVLQHLSFTELKHMIKNPKCLVIKSTFT